MNEYELERIKKSQAVITNVAVEAKKVGFSYGQLQAQRYEQELKLQRLQVRAAEEQKQLQQTSSSVEKTTGRPQRQMPESFAEVAEMLLSGRLSKKQASSIMRASRQTIQKWLDEYVSNSRSCSK